MRLLLWCQGLQGCTDLVWLLQGLLQMQARTVALLQGWGGGQAGGGATGVHAKLGAGQAALQAGSLRTAEESSERGILPRQHAERHVTGRLEASLIRTGLCPRSCGLDQQAKSHVGVAELRQTGSAIAWQTKDADEDLAPAATLL